jgi:hypothetical protein
MPSRGTARTLASPLLAMLMLAMLAACGTTTRADLGQLERMQRAAQGDPRANAAEQIACTGRDLVCARMLALRGAACQRLAESPDTATRVRSRACALDDFQAAARQLPADAPAEDRRKVLTGLAEAQKVARDNSADMAAAAQLNTALRASATSLQGVAGGAPFARYFEADALTFTGQRGNLAPAEACRTLGEARAMLPGPAAPGTGVPTELAQRTALLGDTIASAMRTRGCA